MEKCSSEQDQQISSKYFVKWLSISKLLSKVWKIQTTLAGKVGKIFDGEMFIGTRLTNLLQIFCKMIVNFKVIVKSMKDPDDTRWYDGLTKD